MELIALALLVVIGQWLMGLALASRVTGWLRLGSVAFLTLTPLLGILALGLLTLAVGHLALLGPWLPWAGVLVGAFGVALERRPLRRHVAVLRRAILQQWKVAPVSVSAVLFGLVLAGIASLAPPFRVDEKEYHWAAPVEWASTGRWAESSYRHVDSFPFMEIAYTYAATVHSFAGAHLIHLSTLVALGCGAAWAAGLMGVRATGAVGAAAIAMPVAWDQAYVAYNDTAVAAFSMAAVAMALRARWDRGSLLVVCALLATAISIKPTAVGAVGVVGLVVLMDALQHRDRTSRTTLGRVLSLWAFLAVTALLTMGIWTVRRFVLTGTWVDPDVMGPPTADELSRLPSLTDQVLAPVMPFVLGVLGSAEPWGGRTAVVLQVLLLPAIIYAVVRRREIGNRFVRVVVPAWAHWVVVGLVGVRTRFHILTWVMLVIAVRIAVEDAGSRFGKLRPWLSVAWGGAVVLGVVDSSFEMLRVIRTIEL